MSICLHVYARFTFRRILLGSVMLKTLEDKRMQADDAYETRSTMTIAIGGTANELDRPQGPGDFKLLLHCHVAVLQ